MNIALKKSQLRVDYILKIFYNLSYHTKTIDNIQTFYVSLFCCDFFRTYKYIISDIFRMSIVILRFFQKYEKEDKMTLRERVKDLCKANGISLNKLENECGLGKGYVSKLDKSKPNTAKIQKIADYFGVSLDYLATGEEPSFDKYSDEMARLFAKIGNDVELSKALLKYFDLSDVKKNHVVELINLLSEA